MKITKENKLQVLLEHLDTHLTMFIHDEVIGVTLNGGLSRGYGDHLSEIDVTVYFSHKGYKAFNKGHYMMKEGIAVLDEQLYDIKVLNYDEEIKKDFSVVTELWDMSYAKVLYDPSGKIDKFLKDKLKRKVQFSDLGGKLFEAYWHFRLATDIWLYREDPFQGHFMLNEGAKKILIAIYLANQVYVPHEKWLIHNLYTLEWLPSTEEVLLFNLFGTGDFSLESVRLRQKYFKDTYELIDKKMHENFDLDISLDTSRISFYNKIKEIVEKRIIKKDEFDQLYGLRQLHLDPFVSFMKLDGEHVVVDMDKFLALGPGDMYSWHYSVVDEVKKLL